ncbi:MAG TPA: DUF1552 domain-containing protein [Polyangiaceae bacterium]|nr:DUF1552 domain-containing protein [Polyangiaceae bacterium]
MNYTNRRIFLKGLGGALVAAPFLPSLFEKTAYAAAPGPAKRLIVYFTHYGCVTNQFFPKKLDGDLTEADFADTNIKALAPYYKKLLLPRGIRSMNEWTASNTGAGKGRGQGNDPHTQVTGSYFTCQPVTPNTNSPFDIQNTAAKFNAKPIGRSLDHVIAEQISPQGEPLLLHLSSGRDGAQSAISYSAAETIFNPVRVTDAYSKLTGLFKTGTPMTADTWAVAKGKAITDLVKNDLDWLKRQKMSSADKQKIEAWAALLNSVGTIMGSAGCNADLAGKLGANKTLGASGGDALTRKVSGSTDMDGADLHMAVAALTAACDANPVIFIKSPTNFVFSGLGINADHHNQSHRLDNAGMSGACVTDAVANLIKIDIYQAQKFANLIKYLDSIPEGSGTVLDTSIAVWMNEMSDGNAHNLNNTPIIQAGSGGGYFKTGKTVMLDTAAATADQMLGRSLSQCYMGNTTMANGTNQGTGTEAKYGNAPMNKYFVNWMNALGIKADANGFPAKNGPASQVTKFGYSDKTEDFAGGAGAVTGATIHSPGPFDALKA